MLTTNEAERVSRITMAPASLIERHCKSLSFDDALLAVDCAASLNVGLPMAVEYVTKYRDSPTLHMEKMRLRRAWLDLRGDLERSGMGRWLQRLARALGWVSVRLRIGR